MKIAFVWYWDMASEIYPLYRDGLRAALEIVGKKHEITTYFDKRIPEPDDNFDFILLWSDSNCPFINQLYKYSGRKGLCYGSTFEPNIDNLKKFDVVFIENTPMYEYVRANGIRAIKAFGTDIDFYCPDDTVEKDIEFFFPGTFSPWKRQSDIAYYGSKLTCCGYVQPDGKNELRACMDAGVNVIPRNLSAQEMVKMYQRSKKVIIPSHFGSERTVLEAMSCNVWPIITNPKINVNAASFVEEYMEERKTNPDLQPREFIIKNYSHTKYAEQLLKGIET